MDILRDISTCRTGRRTLRLLHKGSSCNLEDSCQGTSQPSNLAIFKSEGEVSDALLSTYVEQRGLKIQNLLLSKAVLPDSASSKDALDLHHPNYWEWSYKDILCMPTAQQKEWRHAYQQELDSLCAHDVYQLINPLKGRRIIKNKWVFNIKSDGWKHSQLVTKGFSWVKGIQLLKKLS